MFRFLVAGALLAGTPICASAQRGPSQLEAIADAVADCWAAVGPRSVDAAVLRQRGWQAGSIKNPQGGSVNTPLQIYSKAGSNVLLLLMGAKTPSLCSVTSKVTAAADVSLAAQAAQRRLMAADPKVGTARSGRSIVFLSLPKIAMLDATGTKAEPALRVVVQFQTPEKK